MFQEWEGGIGSSTTTGSQAANSDLLDGRKGDFVVDSIVSGNHLWIAGIGGSDRWRLIQWFFSL